LIVVGYWCVKYGSRLIPGLAGEPLTTYWGPINAVLLLVWWLFIARVPSLDRWLVPVFITGVSAAIVPLLHFSMKYLHRDGIAMLALPIVISAAVGWFTLSTYLSWNARRVMLYLVIVASWTSFALVRVDGLKGDQSVMIRWRWLPTDEERFLASKRVETSRAAPQVDSGSLVVQPSDWPEFRGLRRDGCVRNLQILTDWAKLPPRKLWKRPVGPGWSSFAVVGEACFTQEQRGENEAVICYHMETGEEVWVHLDAGRFWDLETGTGPRATPTFHAGRLYTFGAQGLLNCLDPATGTVIWHRDVAHDTEAQVPTWGFASSPLVVGDNVVVYSGGGDSGGAIAYRLTDGEPAWRGGTAAHSYSSAHLAVLCGTEVILMAHGDGLDALAPNDGRLLWQHEWQVPGHKPRVVQPLVLENEHVLLGSGYGMGTRMLKISHGNDSWEAEILWTGKVSPYFNDFVAHQGFLYGFNGNIFCCMDLESGKVKWKQRGYGNGQVLLLTEQNLLFVLSEEGEAVLIATDPNELKELSRHTLLTGKTWNHPVLVRNRLIVRNSEEAACYELAPLP
jgi:outer membrane protein assembly factor BamB